MVKDVKTANYTEIEQLVKGVLKTLKDFKRTHDDCLVRFTIDVMAKNEEEDEEEEEEEVESPRKKRKRKNIVV